MEKKCVLSIEGVVNAFCKQRHIRLYAYIRTPTRLKGSFATQHILEDACPMTYPLPLIVRRSPMQAFLRYMEAAGIFATLIVRPKYPCLLLIKPVHKVALKDLIAVKSGTLGTADCLYKLLGAE